ncbi:peptidase S1 domain-containing protein, partial [Haematococcus lacustris]
MGAPLGQGPRTSSSGSKYLPYHAWRQLDSNDADQSVFEGMQLTVAGWGATSAGTLSNALMQGNVQPLAHDKCIEMFKPWDSKITPRMICTTGNTCAGDSGGPLLLPANLQQQAASSSWLLVGHTSFGFPREKGQ